MWQRNWLMQPAVSQSMLTSSRGCLVHYNVRLKTNAVIEKYLLSLQNLPVTIISLYMLQSFLLVLFTVMVLILRWTIRYSLWYWEGWYGLGVGLIIKKLCHTLKLSAHDWVSKYIIMPSWLFILDFLLSHRCKVQHENYFLVPLHYKAECQNKKI